jgi:hypothetical protein
LDDQSESKCLSSLCACTSCGSLDRFAFLTEGGGASDEQHEDDDQAAKSKPLKFHSAFFGLLHIYAPLPIRARNPSAHVTGCSLRQESRGDCQK